MILEKTKKKDIEAIAQDMSNKLVKQPLFMFYCQNQAKRKSFIKDYFSYFIPLWQKEELLFSDKDNNVLISLVDPTNFEYKYKGVRAYKIRRHETSATVFMHRENIEDIFDILVPPSKKTMLMTIYANPERDFNRVVEVVDEIIEYANKNGISLMYETFSRKYLGFMADRGFAMNYRKQFLNTQFIEAIMIKEPE